MGARSPVVPGEILSQNATLQCRLQYTILEKNQQPIEVKPVTPLVSGATGSGAVEAYLFANRRETRFEFLRFGGKAVNPWHRIHRHMGRCLIHPVDRTANTLFPRQ